MTTIATPSPTFDVLRVRRDFPILDKPLAKGVPLVYLDNAASAQKPSVVIEKEREVYENYYANAYRGVYRFGAQIDEELEGSRAKVQRFIKAASADEIIFTAGTTMSLNLVAAGWARRNLKRGDEILLTMMEHHANFVPWQQVAKETGAICRFWPLTQDGQIDVSRTDEFLSKRTRLLAITGMSNVLGTLTPLPELIRQARQVGAVTVVDAAQSVPHATTDVTAMDADFLAFSGHKLYGPTGVGVLYGRKELLDATEPLTYGGHMISKVSCDATTWAESPAKFEGGTPAIAQAIALGAAIDYVEQLGWDSIQTHERMLLDLAHERLAEIPGLRIWGPAPEHKGAIVSFTVEGAHPEDLAQLLDRRGVFVRHGHHCTMPLHDWLKVPATVRASFALYNTAAEVELLVEAIHFALQKLRLE